MPGWLTSAGVLPESRWQLPGSRPQALHAKSLGLKWITAQGIEVNKRPIRAGQFGA